MTDFIVLKRAINNSRLELGDIANKLNISSEALSCKINGDLDFKVSEVRTLGGLLKLNNLQMKEIFSAAPDGFKSNAVISETIFKVSMPSLN